MALPPSTANWHWKSKDVTRWGTEWFERELVTISVKSDREGEVVSITNVSEVEGDIQLGQRKSKLITIYDCKVVMDWEGTTADGTQVKGTVTIPEVSHEVTVDGLSEYSYNWRCTTASSPEVQSVFSLAKSRLPIALETKLAEFPSAIIDTHGKDLTVSADPSRSGTPAPGPASVNASAPIVASTSTPTSAQPVKTAPKMLNTTVVTVEATFHAPADDLFNLLTDEKRITIWTRAPAQSNPQPDSDYSLFGDGVHGKYISLNPSREIVQTWALRSPTWPANHTATLRTTLEQSTDSTQVTFRLEGVPIGMEEEIKKNIEGYYIRGFKSIGYVELVQLERTYTPSQKSRASRLPSHHNKNSVSSSSYTLSIVIACIVLVAAFSIPYLSASSSKPL